jgi:hypothetical protein
MLMKRNFVSSSSIDGGKSSLEEPSLAAVGSEVVVTIQVVPGLASAVMAPNEMASNTDSIRVLVTSRPGWTFNAARRHVISTMAGAVEEVRP